MKGKWRKNERKIWTKKWKKIKEKKINVTFIISYGAKKDDEKCLWKMKDLIKEKKELEREKKKKDDNIMLNTNPCSEVNPSLGGYVCSNKRGK